MTNAPSQPDFAPSGFFALRTPLLPVEEWRAWGDRLVAPQADAAELEAALKVDRQHLRDQLCAVFARADVREALFLASPDLDEAFDVWRREPESKKGQRVEAALVRYFARMTGRATPFGLFAGASVGTVGEQTRLELAARAQYQRHTRLDMDYLSALTEALARAPELRARLRYRPNTSLYRSAGRMRYVETQLKDKLRAYQLVAVDDNEYLAATLERARAGATLAELAAALVEPEITQDEAESYLGELIDNQILVPELALPVTGDEAIHPLIEQLNEAAPPMAAVLAQARDQLAALDAARLGAAPERYRALARALAELPTKAELPRLFQVDLVKPASAATPITLGRNVVDEIANGVRLLHRLAPASETILAQFAKAFSARYEEREVSLVEALDDESGLGFPVTNGPGNGGAPLLKGLAWAGASEMKVAWGARETLLLAKLSEALATGATEITLSTSELEKIAVKDPLPLPAAFDTMVALAAASDEALERGEFRLWLHGASGPSGARMLGRFCHADAQLHAQVAAHLRAEEAQQPDAVFAELVHLPEGRVGNVLARPVLRDYEIAYLGQSGAPLERQIPLTDLYVSVRQGRIVLRSARLGREVLPRLTTAHNLTTSSLSVYKFLGALQWQQTAGALGWDWGALAAAPFLPRVTSGRLILALARWRVLKAELEGFGKLSGAARFQAVQQWRAARRLPRLVALADGDNVLPVDLDNALSVESFVQLVKDRAEITLTESFPQPDELCARGPEGRFVHELIVPFVRVKDVASETRETQSPLHPFTPSPLHPFTRRFAPGSEWLYAKLYCGATTVDRVLREVVAPLTRAAVEWGAVDRWFFIRYADPDWHLRLRWHGTPQRLRAEVLPALHAALEPLLEDGRLWRVQLETYEREVERYGGAAGIELAEQIFHADSEAALEIVEQLERGEAGADERWRLTLRGMDLLLDDLGFDLAAKLAVLQQARKSFAQEFRADERFIGQLGDRFRQERQSLTALLDPAREAESELAAGLQVLRRRSQRLAPICAELRAAELAAPLATLALSYLHMHANRLLRAAQRAQELVIYDFLARLYQSQTARAHGRGASIQPMPKSAGALLAGCGA